MQLSEHIFLSQLDQPAAYGCEAVSYPEEWIQERAVVLASVVEIICQELGFPPLRITSGYRSREFNRALRAAGYHASEKSQHSEGRAVDLSFDGISPTEVYCAALHCHHRGLIRLGGLGLYSRWVHLDIRPGMLSQWFR
jgi:uncharacterized protein YcbK (DUF882 family)